MPHIEIMNRIIEAEKHARNITDDAEQKLQALDGDLKSRRDAMEADYMTRAQRKLDEIEISENKYADEQIAILQQALQTELEESERAAKENTEKWVDTLFEEVKRFPLR